MRIYDRMKVNHADGVVFQHDSSQPCFADENQSLTLNAASLIVGELKGYKAVDCMQYWWK